MNRKEFLKQFGLISGSAFIALQAPAMGSLKHDSTISGKVSYQGKGIAKAVLSDGFSVVQTDKEGNYQIQVNPLAHAIFLSTPAGYEFNSFNHVTQQYEHLGARNQYNFKLQKLKQNDDHHHFIIWADPQVKNKSDVEKMMTTSVPDVQEVVKSIGKNALIHGITVGDIVWDNLFLYEDYNQAVAKMGIPFFQALGNHDMDYRQGGDETSDKTFKKYYGPTYYSFNRGKAHYIVLDDVRYLGTERNYDGYITEAQLAWMEKDLAFIPADNLVIINLHIPVYSSVKNRAAFYEILKNHKNVHVMSGHTHHNKNVFQNGIYEHIHGTVCGAWWTGPICEDGTPRGYGVYEVKGNRLSWYYKSTGKPRAHQISIDVEELTNQKRVLANIWNHDPQWKIACYLDGKLVEMEKTIGFDPEAVRLYKGDKLPSGRTFAEPKKTDHIFMVHAGPDLQHVKIVATDPFGNQYIAEKKA
ncbi:MAG: metallophosphoesterase [Pedobacter sp.]|nr:MAG: metallophosphoesterase [Pedobacter sp.]